MLTQPFVRFDQWSDEIHPHTWLRFADTYTVFEIGEVGARQNFTMPPLYLAVLPNMLSILSRTEDLAYATTAACHPDTKSHPVTDETPLGAAGVNATYLRCDLYNSTYNARFDFVDGAQAVNITTSRAGEDYTFKMLNRVYGPTTVRDSPSAPHCARSDVPYRNHSACFLDLALVETLAFQSMFQAFATLLTGTIQGPLLKRKMETTTNVRSTGLINTKDLAFLSDYGLDRRLSEKDAAVALQQTLWNTPSEMARHISGFASLRKSTNSETTLRDALEEMFRNFTVSLMGSPVLQSVRSGFVVFSSLAC